MSIFRELSDDEEREFRRWAREHFLPTDPINETWHPVVRDECLLILLEYPENGAGELPCGMFD